MESISVLQNDLKSVINRVEQIYKSDEAGDGNTLTILNLINSLYSKHFIKQNGDEKINLESRRIEYTSKNGVKYYYLAWKSEAGNKKTEYIGNEAKLKKFLELNPHYLNKAK